MKTLYITDLDGTLLNNNAEVSKFTETTLNRLIQKGMQFSFATARTAASTVKILSNINLNIPVILMNGVLIYDMKEKKYIKIETLPNDIIDRIINTFKAFKVTGFMYGIKNDELTNYYESLDSKPLREFYNERVKKYYKTFTQVSLFSDAKDNNIIYFTLMDTQDVLEPVYNALKVYSDFEIVMYKDNYSENLWYLEVFSVNASKYKAVMYLRKQYGYDKIIGFGDNLNDLPLFKACDESYAVENANIQVKSAATAVIDSNENNGVAKWLEKNFKL